MTGCAAASAADASSRAFAFATRLDANATDSVATATRDSNDQLRCRCRFRCTFSHTQSQAYQSMKRAEDAWLSSESRSERKSLLIPRRDAQSATLALRQPTNFVPRLVNPTSCRRHLRWGYTYTQHFQSQQSAFPVAQSKQGFSACDKLAPCLSYFRFLTHSRWLLLSHCSLVSKKPCKQIPRVWQTQGSRKTR